MRRMSAKIKLTIWTALFMVLMAGVLMALMFSLSDTIIEFNSKAELKEVVDDNSGEIEYEKGAFDTSDVDFVKNGVYTLIYTEDGNHIAGNLPEELDVQPSFNDGQVTERQISGTLYYFYDIFSPVEDSNTSVWVRGVIAVDEVASATNSILQMALLSLPIFIIIGAVGCYFIAKRTFMPIDKILKTAKTISENEDLSMRINLKNGSAEIKRLSDTFDTMFERLEGAFEAEKQFTSDVSHELRTPTAVILAQCEYTSGKNVTAEDKDEALETVHRQALKMSKLISDLLNLTRLDSEIEKAQFKNIDLSELVQDVCQEHELIAPKNINFTHDIEPNIKGVFDETMIIRLLTNLISNAFRYTSQKGNAEVSLSQNDSEIILKVKDDGIGISKDDQEKIWKRFYQVDSSRTTSQSGSMGLGLSMVKQIAKIHHAKIEVESELLEGSCFIIKFPKKELTF